LHFSLDYDALDICHRFEQGLKTMASIAIRIDGLSQQCDFVSALGNAMVGYRLHPTGNAGFQFRVGAMALVGKGLGLAAPIAEMGFAVVEIADDEVRELAPGVRCRIAHTDGDDSLMTIDDGEETFLNINDALHSSPRPVRERFTRILREWHPRLDYVFCGYGMASHFPNCYVIPGKDAARSAAKRQRHFNRVWAELVHDLGPRFGFPFAADVVFLEEELFWSNEAVHNGQRPTEAFLEAYPGSSTTVLDIAPGFVIEAGHVVTPMMRTPVREADLRATFADAIARVNRRADREDAAVADVARLLAANAEMGQAYFAAFPGDYRCRIRFRDAALGIDVTKRDGRVTVGATPADAGAGPPADLVLTTRLAYLLRSLTEEYGYELLYVGSGGVFEYADRARVRTSLHREILTMVRQMTAPPGRRGGGARGALARIKALLRRTLRQRRPDLYDLEEWTVFAR
jgi:plasmid stabilization system protein ParE